MVHFRDLCSTGCSRDGKSNASNGYNTSKRQTVSVVSSCCRRAGREGCTEREKLTGL